YDQFQTKGRNIVIGAGNDPQFRKLCAILGKPELAEDPRYKSNKVRVENRAALTAELRVLLLQQDGEALAMELMQSGVPAGVVQTVPDVLNHPHTRHRNMVVAKDRYQGTGWPVKFSRTPASLRSTPPQYGSATRAVLAQAGYGAGEIDAMLQAGIAL